MGGLTGGSLGAWNIKTNLFIYLFGYVDTSFKRTKSLMPSWRLLQSWAYTPVLKCNKKPTLTLRAWFWIQNSSRANNLTKSSTATSLKSAVCLPLRVSLCLWLHASGCSDVDGRSLSSPPEKQTGTNRFSHLIYYCFSAHELQLAQQLRLNMECKRHNLTLKV